LKWAFGWGLPLLIFWVFGIPILGIVFLTLKRKKLEEPVFMSRFMVFYQGLKPSCYYWEFVNTLRKILLICINVLIPIQNLFLKTGLALVMMVLFMRLQIYVKPYKSEAV